MPFYQKSELIEQFPHRWEVVECEESLLIRETLESFESSESRDAKVFTTQEEARQYVESLHSGKLARIDDKLQELEKCLTVPNYKLAIPVPEIGRRDRKYSTSWLELKIEKLVGGSIRIGRIHDAMDRLHRARKKIEAREIRQQELPEELNLPGLLPLGTKVWYVSKLYTARISNLGFSASEHKIVNVHLVPSDKAFNPPASLNYPWIPEYRLSNGVVFHDWQDEPLKSEQPISIQGFGQKIYLRKELLVEDMRQASLLLTDCLDEIGRDDVREVSAFRS